MRETQSLSVPPTPADRWGKDHWSLLAYVEAACVDGRAVEDLGSVGALDRQRLSCNPAGHPLLEAYTPFGTLRWKDEYATRLNDGTTVTGHDDWDCLDDLEAAGLVEVLSLVNGFVVMQDEGLRVAAALRAHKARGGNFAGFRYPAVAPAV